MTRMEAEREADRRNSDKATKTQGFWIAKPGPSLLEGWSVRCVAPAHSMRQGGVHNRSQRSDNVV